ncbi:SRPBCC family protein [Paraflavitalea pollutisoli]|uniref:SRPBCC family protein n=1 Tax=Paraflavitalea pollutisoli TaxID=3034143 RepID=UPI0023EBF017|nr:SRPBCC family protein [Paraflavitalea sp. H1-2-19X]
MLALYIIFGFVAIIIAMLVFALFLPSRYHIERSLVILKPVEEVMLRVSNLHYYSQWNPWQQKEAGSKMEIKGSPQTPGHEYWWSGKKIGEGRLILQSIDSKHVHFNLQFIKPWKSSANDNWLFEAWGNGETKVTWQNYGLLPYPMARLMGPLISKNLNKQFEEGLRNLKKLCEEQSPA